jgi:hypothetical protein
MAGRGTDIPLGPGVGERGGLHVICCQHNSSARIDRQLQGRAARQGDPGSVESVLSLQDGMLARRLPGWLRALAIGLAGRKGIVPRPIGRLLSWLPQQAEERQGSDRGMVPRTPTSMGPHRRQHTLLEGSNAERFRPVPCWKGPARPLAQTRAGQRQERS